MKTKEKKQEDIVLDEVQDNENDNCSKQKIDIDKLLEVKDEEIKTLQNKLMMKEADFINFRRRKEEESSNMIKYASSDLILEILKSIDNLERAISTTLENDENKGLLTGIKMVYDSLVNTLESFGVKEIESLGIKFDHNVHNAVMTDNNPDMDDDIISEVLQKGYLYKDRVLRPAMVKVNKK